MAIKRNKVSMDGNQAASVVCSGSEEHLRRWSQGRRDAV